MTEGSRSPLYLLTGLVIGLVLGILYAWLWVPADTLEARPVDLRGDFKDAYRELVARAYASNSDLGRAEARLALLGDSDPVRALAVQAQLSLGENQPDAARALGILAAHLQDGPESTSIAIAYPQTPSPGLGSTNASGSGTTLRTSTPRPTERAEATMTPRPNPTATATQGPPFVLADYALVCDEAILQPQIQVYVFDGAGKPVSGVGIVVTWQGGINRFLTGLKPEFGLGYADFTMEDGMSYTLRLEDGGDPVEGLTGRECEGGFWGSWRLNFIQP